MPTYANLADAIADDIAAGRLRAGDRLPPQREFAYRRGIAVSTAGRVYAELLRRRLAVGEVGRGTFVAAASRVAMALSEPSGLKVDLELNHPVLSDQAARIAKSLAPLLRADALAGALPSMTAAGTAAGRAIAAGFLARRGWRPSTDQILFTGSGKQAIAAAVAALVSTGGRLGVEAVTYPVVKGLAARLGVTIVPLPMDAHGVRPDRLREAHAGARLSALYLQPVLHNPLGLTMPTSRREEIARFVREHDLTVIEDGIYAFLADEPPLAALLPDHCIVVDSLSKRVAPGLTIGFVAAPAPLVGGVARAIRSGAWFASGFAFDAGLRLMADGTAAAIARAKRKDAAARQSIAAKVLDGFAIRANPHAYHLWLELPKVWRSDRFAAAAAREGIALAQSSVFAASEGHAPNAIRIALASPPVTELRRALEILAKLLRSKPDEFAVVE